MLLNFTRYDLLEDNNFFLQTYFFTEEKHRQRNLDSKVKVFHESISCFIIYP